MINSTNTSTSTQTNDGLNIFRAQKQQRIEYIKRKRIKQSNKMINCFILIFIAMHFITHSKNTFISHMNAAGLTIFKMFGPKPATVVIWCLTVSCSWILSLNSLFVLCTLFCVRCAVCEYALKFLLCREFRWIFCQLTNGSPTERLRYNSFFYCPCALVHSSAMALHLLFPVLFFVCLVFRLSILSQ